MKLRIYFNRRGTKDEAWSIDTGHGTERQHFESVRIITSNVLETVATGEEPDWRNPVAWIEVDGTLTVLGKRALITWAPEKRARKNGKVRSYSDRHESVRS